MNSFPQEAYGGGICQRPNAIGKGMEGICQRPNAIGKGMESRCYLPVGI